MLAQQFRTIGRRNNYFVSMGVEFGKRANFSRKSSTAGVYHGNSQKRIFDPAPRLRRYETDINLQTELSPEADLLKSRLLEGKPLSLDTYLQSDHFNFGEKQVSSLQLLEEYMKLVWSKDKPLVSIDCEAYEHAPKKITEIGVSILDPTKYSLSPQIQTIHIVIKEHLSLRNGKYVADNKNKFMGGISHVLSIKEANKMMQLLSQKYLVDKKGILVGHHVGSDIGFLKSLKISLPEDIDQIDTLKLHKISRNKGGSLHMILKALGIPYAHLHNAGNDAYYTLLVALAYCDPVVRLDKNLDVLLDGTKTVQVPVDHKDKALFYSVDSATQLMQDLF
ncbi:uncharacterized protein SPAPADRAFT_63840 [Spathaspora passalidarum NRRL Y-27907]|uniref:Gfd2/YDR514C-like C-terminal domain-containing protein n=1 Tax=Spathaspora passalidarum (strain NRRL Y-27907 / 11-Y1) TaxID=619300 RepID=G3AVQ6_SPAPN|nr:uncharacterized protein SPAPADRAFT_63840 [Spathaspora passalidarum NRRL Y-27907]EGW30221.1 hypothetical protein SPAPADRAFT_63840 [Spathaspora passalidarum NRRL Y-27907]